MVRAAVTAGQLSRTDAVSLLLGSLRGADVPPHFGGSSAVVSDSLTWDAMDLSAGLGGAELDRLGALLLPSVYDDLAIIAGRPSCRLSPKWVSKVSAGGRVRVWYLGDSKAAAALADFVVAEVDPMWVALEGLLGRRPVADGGSLLPCRGGDDLLDIVIEPNIPVSSTRPYYPAGTWDCSEKAVHIALKAPFGWFPDSGDQYRGTVIHELMHAFQFGANWADSCGPLKWFFEANAEWAIDYVAAGLQDEHPAARTFLRRPSRPLTETDGRREYGAYLFFFREVRTHGPILIRRLFDQGERVTILTAIDRVLPGGFTAEWPAFARDSWNPNTPFGQYRQWDSLDATPELKSDDAVVPSGTTTELTYEDALEPLSARYRRFTFSGAPVRGISLSISSDTPQHLHGEVLVRKRGRDWARTNLETRVDGALLYCTDTAGERIDEAVVILSNSQLPTGQESPLAGKVRVTGTTIGCQQWSGTVTVTFASAWKNYTATFTGLIYRRKPESPLLFSLRSGTVKIDGGDYVDDQGCRHRRKPQELTVRTDMPFELYWWNPEPRSAVKNDFARFRVNGGANELVQEQLTCPQVGNSTIDFSLGWNLDGSGASGFALTGTTKYQPADPLARPFTMTTTWKFVAQRDP